VIEVNRKIIVIVLAIAVVLLATPYIGMVYAGKGQDKLSFEFVLTGMYTRPGEVLESGIRAHLWDMPFISLAPMVVEIDGTPIPSNLLSYTGSLRVNLGENINGNGGETLKVTETITIWEDAAHTILRGTLELHVMGNVEQGQGVGAGNNFNGFGTGDFAGVKLCGDTVGLAIVDGMVQLTRVGTIMGWPD